MLRRAALGLFVVVAIAQPASAAPELNRHDWEQFVQEATASETVVATWLGRKPSLDTEGAEGRHLIITDRAPYTGGIDVYTSPKGEVSEAIFYLIEGPLYLASQIKRAATLKTAWTLADVERWYGSPAERTTSGRTGATVLTYHFQGDPKRWLMFSSLPRSPYLHRIIAGRGGE